MPKKKPKTAAPPPADLLELRYVPVDQAARWDRNPKRHDLDALRRSIELHGFKDPPKYEPTLNAGGGGLVEGNGRAELLAIMAGEEGAKPPRGIAVDPEGRWCMPVLFGVDAASRALAEAYAIDHNNLTLSGGDVGLEAMLTLYDEEGLAEVLKASAADGVEPVSLDGDELAELLAAGGEWEEGYDGRLDKMRAAVTVRPLFALAEVETLERAITRTGMVSRAEALMEICRSYLGEDEEP